MRASQKPLRPLSKLSTRALAVHLATLPESANRLCGQRAEAPNDTLQNLTSLGDGLSAGAKEESLDDISPGLAPQSMALYGTQKDVKSFTQRVFDTKAMKGLKTAEAGYTPTQIPGTIYQLSDDSTPRSVKHTFISRCGVPFVASAVLYEWNGQGFQRHSTAILQMLQDIDSSSYAVKSKFIRNFKQRRLTVDLVNASALASSWLKGPPGKLHVLRFPWLFHSDCLAIIFRALCFEQLRKASKAGGLHRRMMSQSFVIIADGQSASPTDTSPHEYFDRIKSAGRSFLSLQVSREHLVRDTLNQLCSKKSHELRLPLKVKILNQGEEGLDQGGVAQEFLNLLFAELLAPESGMSTLLLCE